MSIKSQVDDDFKDFESRVLKIEKIVKKLASDDAEEQKEGMQIADLILENSKKTIKDRKIQDDGLIVKCNKTIINKKFSENDELNKSSQIHPEAFMKMIEKDTEQRTQDRKARNDRADQYKQKGNTAFSQGDYAKAISHYDKAINERKDSTVIWNNRALAYMKLGRYKKALEDFNWALRINNSKNIKALLNSAKCHTALGNREKCNEFIALAKDYFPDHLDFIIDFDNNLKQNSNNVDLRND